MSGIQSLEPGQYLGEVIMFVPLAERSKYSMRDLALIPLKYRVAADYQIW